MSERNYYCICENGCRFPTMTSEQIIAAIAEATGNAVTNVDDAFISKIRDMNASRNLTFWVGKSAEYNAIVAANQIVENCLYILTDESYGGDVERAISDLTVAINSLGERVNVATFDTGWTFEDPDTSTTSWRYRLKNGVAYITFTKKYSNSYAGVPEFVECNFPFKLDLTGNFDEIDSVRPAMFPACKFNESTGERSVIWLSAFQDAEFDTTTIKSVESISANEYVTGTIAFPYIAGSEALG